MTEVPDTQADGRPAERCPVFDPHSPDLTPDRAYELYAELRTTCPVSRGEEHGGYWALSRYADVKATAMDHDRFSSTGGVYVPAVSTHRFPPIDHDPPEHGRFRALIAPLTSPAAARRMEPAIQATVDQLVDRFIDTGRAELVEELAVPLPLDVITQLYGLSPTHAEDIGATRWSSWSTPPERPASRSSSACATTGSGSSPSVARTRGTTSSPSSCS